MPLPLHFAQDTMVELPNGWHDVDATATGGDVIGGGMRGTAGRTPHSSGSGNSQNGLGTVLTWAGAADTPMFDIGGSFYTLTDMAIKGVEPTGNGEDDMPAVRIGKATGIGSGKHRFERLYIDDCSKAFQAGILETDGNSDHCYMRNIFCRQVSRFFQSRNDQSMGHIFQDIQWQEGVATAEDGISVVFDYLYGGLLRAYQVDIKHNALVLKTGSTGPNTDLFHINGIKVDAQVGANFRLVETTGANRAHVFVSNLKIPSAVYDNMVPGQMARVFGPSICTIRDSAGLPAGCLYGEQRAAPVAQRWPTFIIENCFCDIPTDQPELLVHAGGSQKCRLTVRNCFTFYGVPIDNVDRLQIG